MINLKLNIPRLIVNVVKFCIEYINSVRYDARKYSKYKYKIAKYEDRGKISKAIKFAHKAYAVTDTLMITNGTSDFLEFERVELLRRISSLYMRQGNTEQALRHNELANKLERSNINKQLITTANDNDS